MGIAAFAAQGVQPLSRNIVTENTPDIQVSGVFSVSQSAHAGLAPYRSALLVRQIGICSYSLVATSMATKRILSLKSVGIFPKIRLSQSESAKQSAAYKN